MKILIAGGNGYVGRVLCQILYDKHDVCVIDNLRYGANRFKQDELKKIRFEEADLRHKSNIADIVNKYTPNVIINLAAIHFIPECENDPELAISTNICGTVNLLSVCPSDCRFVFASSGAVYQPDNNPYSENSSPLGPLDIYGYTKLHGEDYVKYFSKLKNFPAVIVRLFNVVGPGETNPHVLPEIVAQLKAGRKSLKLGNLKPKRDYIYVKDAALGFAATALNGDVKNGETAVVNLGSQIQYSVEELLKKIKNIAEIEFEVETDTTRLRKVDRPFLGANITKIKELFKWNPQFDMDFALTEMWKEPDLPKSLIRKYEL